MKIKEDNKIFKYSDLSTKEQRNIVKNLIGNLTLNM